MSTENTANKHDEEDCFNDIYDDAFLAELDLIESQQLNTLSGRLETASLATQQQATTTDHQPFDQSLDETDGLKHTIRRLEEKIEQINQARKEEDRRIHQERIELDFKRQEIESQRVKLLIIEQARQQEKPKEPTQSEKRKKGFPDQSYFQQSSSRSQKKSFSIQSQTISPSTHSLYQPIDYHQPKPIQPAVVLPLAQPSSKHQYTPIDIEQNHLHHLFDNIRNQWRKSHKNSPELDTAEASVLFINQLRPSTDNLKCQDQLNRLADDIDTLLRGSSTTPLAITVHILLRHIKQALLICIQMRQTKVIKKYLEFVSVLTSYYDEACLFIAWDTEQDGNPSTLSLIKDSINHFLHVNLTQYRFETIFRQNMDYANVCEQAKMYSLDPHAINSMLHVSQEDATEALNDVLDIFSNLLRLPFYDVSRCLGSFPLIEMGDAIKDTRGRSKLNQLRRVCQSIGRSL